MNKHAKILSSQQIPKDCGTFNSPGDAAQEVEDVQEVSARGAHLCLEPADR